jgi:hypothetical protein
MFDAPQLTLHPTSIWQSYRNRRFSILLVILLGLLAGPPLLLDAGISAAWFDALMSLFLLAVILSLCVDRRQRLFALALGLPTIIFTLGGHTLPGQISAWALFCGQICQVVFLFGAAGLIVRSLFAANESSFDSVLGAVCGYLFLGLGWAVIYSIIDKLRPESFHVNPLLLTSADASHLTPQILTYYSFVTLTTVGYGDVTPVSAAARTLAWMEAIAGQFYVAVIVAGLVSLMVANKSRTNTVESI